MKGALKKVGGKVISTLFMLLLPAACSASPDTDKIVAGPLNVDPQALVALTTEHDVQTSETTL